MRIEELLAIALDAFSKDLGVRLVLPADRLVEDGVQLFAGYGPIGEVLNVRGDNVLARFKSDDMIAWFVAEGYLETDFKGLP